MVKACILDESIYTFCAEISYEKARIHPKLATCRLAIINTECNLFNDSGDGLFITK